ncbi:MAG: DnaA regulatory inactivator Hda [Gammaproteobacteria bacterium]|nr:DnaA regulatory inactivator Hda [Gammaproteobacteria bacterium]
MSIKYPQQLLLGVKLDDEATYDNFFVADANTHLVQYMQNNLASASGKFLFIWGSTSAGKTHLQQAICHQVTAAGKTSIFIPLAECGEIAPEILEGLEQLDLVCLDDIDAALGKPEWEMALFNLYNRARESGTAIIITGRVAPQHLVVSLPDLRSRLQSAVVFQLHGLSDEEKSAMLKMRAGHRGIDLPDPVVEFILQRSKREVVALLDVLHRLDRQSLEQKRRITIPLVKQTMLW